MRVAGDVADLAVLKPRTASLEPQRQNAKIAMMAVAGITALDMIAALAVTAQKRRPSAGVRTYTNRSGFPNGLAAARGAARTRTSGTSTRASYVETTRAV